MGKEFNSYQQQPVEQPPLQRDANVPRLIFESKVLSMNKVSQPRTLITLSIEKTRPKELILADPKSASIKELTAVITESNGIDDEEIKKLKRIRRGKAIHFLKTYHRIGVEKMMPVIMAGKRTWRDILDGEKEVSLEQQERLTTYFENIPDAYPETAALLRPEIRANNPEERIYGRERAVASLLDSIGLTVHELGDLIHKKHDTISKIKTERGIKAADLAVFLNHAQKSYEEREAARKVLRSDLEDLKTSFGKGEPLPENPLDSINLNLALPEDHKDFVKQETVAKQWLQTLWKRASTSADVMLHFRLSIPLTIEEFSRFTEISSLAITRTKGGPPLLSLVNKLLESSPLRDLGKESKPIQLTRLLMNSTKPFTNEELKISTSDELATKLLLQKGVTRGGIPGLNTEVLITGLGLNSQENQADQALEQIIRSKNSHEAISPELYHKAVSGKGTYLFAEELTEVGPPALTPHEQMLAKQIKDLRSGQAFKLLRQDKRVSAEKLSQITSMQISTIRRIENRETPAGSHNIAGVMKGIGYDIHNPLTWQLVDKALSEKKTLREQEPSQQRITLGQKNRDAQEIENEIVFLFTNTLRAIENHVLPLTEFPTLTDAKDFLRLYSIISVKKALMENHLMEKVTRVLKQKDQMRYKKEGQIAKYLKHYPQATEEEVSTELSLDLLDVKRIFRKREALKTTLENKQERNNFKLTESNDTARFLGMMIGKGSVNSTGLIFHHKDPEIRNLFELLGGEALQLQTFPVDEETNPYQVQFASKKHAKALTGLQRQNQVESLNEETFNWAISPQFIDSFISGFFDTNAFFNQHRKGANIFFNSSQQERTNFYLYLFDKFGVRHARSLHKRGIIIDHPVDLQLTATRITSMIAEKQAFLDALKSGTHSLL